MAAKDVPQLMTQEDHFFLLGQVFLQKNDPQVGVLIGKGRLLGGIVKQLQGGQQGGDISAVGQATVFNERKALRLQGFFKIRNGKRPMMEF